MSKQKKLILGIATAWPLLYVFLFVVVWIVMFSTSAQTWLFSVIIPLHLFTIVESIVLLGIYTHLLMKGGFVPAEDRTQWLLGLIFGGLLGQAAFFALKIWQMTAMWIRSQLFPPLSLRSDQPFIYTTSARFALRRSIRQITIPAV